MKNTFKKQIKSWFLEHPELNPYKLSFKKLFRNLTSGLRPLPDFIIIGAGRSGTTALYSYLIQHPSIVAALTDSKKPVDDFHFFEYMTSNSVRWYKSHFPILFNKFKTNKHSLITGEYTSTYMYHPDVPHRIRNLLPKIKLIVILRNPVDKAYSTYQQQSRFGECITSFEETINAELIRTNLNINSSEIFCGNPNFNNYVAQNIIRHGIYADYLENWIKIFDRDQIFIVNSSDLKNSTKETLSQIYKFLNIFEYDVEPKNNSTVRTTIRKYPLMDKSTRKKLLEFYKPHNKKLNVLLGTSFDWNK